MKDIEQFAINLNNFIKKNKDKVECVFSDDGKSLTAKFTAKLTDTIETFKIVEEYYPDQYKNPIQRRSLYVMKNGNWKRIEMGQYKPFLYKAVWTLHRAPRKYKPMNLELMRDIKNLVKYHASEIKNSCTGMFFTIKGVEYSFVHLNEKTPYIINNNTKKVVIESKTLRKIFKGYI